jgi:carboxypeptidase family protein
MSIRRNSLLRQAVVAVLACVLALGPGFAAPVAEQDGRGAIRGVLYEPDGDTKLTGGKATAVNVKTGRQYVSNVTGGSGSYEIKGLPAGSYDLVVEAGGYAYVADNLIDVAEGDSVPVDVSVQPKKPASRIVVGLPEPKGSAEVVGGPEVPVARSFWKTPGGILLISVLGVGAVLLIADDDGKSDASPSSP